MSRSAGQDMTATRVRLHQPLAPSNDRCHPPPVFRSDMNVYVSACDGTVDKTSDFFTYNSTESEETKTSLMYLYNTESFMHQQLERKGLTASARASQESERNEEKLRANLVRTPPPRFSLTDLICCRTPSSSRSLSRLLMQLPSRPVTVLHGRRASWAFSRTRGSRRWSSKSCSTPSTTRSSTSITTWPRAWPTRSTAPATRLTPNRPRGGAFCGLALMEVRAQRKGLALEVADTLVIWFGLAAPQRRNPVIRARGALSALTPVEVRARRTGLSFEVAAGDLAWSACTAAVEAAFTTTTKVCPARGPDRVWEMTSAYFSEPDARPDSRPHHESYQGKFNPVHRG
jgi:hypothetical protein